MKWRSMPWSPFIMRTYYNRKILHLYFPLKNSFLTEALGLFQQNLKESQVCSNDEPLFSVTGDNNDILKFFGHLDFIFRLFKWYVLLVSLVCGICLWKRSIILIIWFRIYTPTLPPSPNLNISPFLHLLNLLHLEVI